MSPGQRYFLVVLGFVLFFSSLIAIAILGFVSLSAAFPELGQDLGISAPKSALPSLLLACGFGGPFVLLTGAGLVLIGLYKK